VGNQSTGEGTQNTAVGTAALLFNTTGSANTANGVLALFANTTGSLNTALGYAALKSNDGGTRNTAIGFNALLVNTSGNENTAVGFNALESTTGSFNTAVGDGALAGNDTGGANSALGDHALFDNTTGSSNTAVGLDALQSNSSGSGNTAAGLGALVANTTVDNNVGLGPNAGSGVTTASNVICIGNVSGADVDNRNYIANVGTTTVSGGGTDGLTVNLSTGLIGHLSSSRRYKEDIKPMQDASQTLYRLKPVTYRYKKEIDSTQSQAFGLIAEEVAEVNPDLVACNAEGQPESVHYEMVNAMLLNEFLKEHRKVEKQRSDFEAALAQQQKQIESLTVGLQKVSAQLAAAGPSDGGLGLSKFATGRIRRGGPPPQVVVNKP
jgi:hypothetical protein